MLRISNLRAGSQARGRRNRIELLGSPEFPGGREGGAERHTITNRQYPILQFAFLSAYSVMCAGGGRIVERVGSAAYTVVVLWWFCRQIFCIDLPAPIRGGVVHQHPGCRKHKFTDAGVRALVKDVFEAGYGEGSLYLPETPGASTDFFAEKFEQLRVA